MAALLTPASVGLVSGTAFSAHVPVQPHRAAVLRTLHQDGLQSRYTDDCCLHTDVFSLRLQGAAVSVPRSLVLLSAAQNDSRSKAPSPKEQFGSEIPVGDVDDLLNCSWEDLQPRVEARSYPYITYSRKVFIPLTRLCRDSCGYCTFAAHSGVRDARDAYLTPEQVLQIARDGADAGCTEALFTLGDRPEERWPAAAEHLALLGYDSTISYVAAMCKLVLEETGLLPHTNCGLLSAREMALLRSVSVSQGLMLESVSEALLDAGGAHDGCETKAPRLRLATLERAGRLRVPFTTGLLLGIGESRSDVLRALVAIRDSHARWGHVQEVIVQPFRAKAGTRMADTPDLPHAELLWAVCAAKLILGASVPVQSPPNLSAAPRELEQLILCGLDDWGGISPVTADHVNPECRWPQIGSLRLLTESCGLTLVPRLAVYPRFASHRSVGSRALDRWQGARVATAVRRLSDAHGLARGETAAARSWCAGSATPVPSETEEDELKWLPFGSEWRARRRWRRDGHVSAAVRAALLRVADGNSLRLREVETLLGARGADLSAVCHAADEVRRDAVGAGVSFVVCRNINYTNKCMFTCTFCAFSKGRAAEKLRGAAYELAEEEVARRTAEAWERGATEVCMQGGIHPSYTADSYLSFLRAARAASPDVHVHAFSPLEVSQGAAASGLSLTQFLHTLRREGLGSLPGTAAEVLSDAARAELCPDKLSTREWLRVVASAHEAGLPTTSTIMFGAVEGAAACAKHLMRLRLLQVRAERRAAAATDSAATDSAATDSAATDSAVTAAVRPADLASAAPARLTEFVPLPFVHESAPIFLMGGARRGPTLREAVLLHAVARLALHPHVPSIQTSWTKMGARGAAMALCAGANDLGGTLMNERISRAAGASHGQEMTPQAMRHIINNLPPDETAHAALKQGAHAEHQQLLHVPNDPKSGSTQEPPGARTPRWAWQRTTLYAQASEERISAATAAKPLLETSS